MLFTPSRAAGLSRLNQFLPNAGKAYENTRNYDDPPAGDGLRSNVSQLSPWLHVGLLSETEVIETVLAKHTPKAADKFIAEVFWRVYFKGYLEQRPSIWRSFCRDRDAALAKLDANAGLAKAYAQATQGHTGIAAFDHWAQELTATGYLHNHARMWFASIWIFTLKLDWQLGADFFLRHLIDGDAASNTLSWRWVGGLHTKGKTYLARADNIARYTANHSQGPLSAVGLAEDAPTLEERDEHGRNPITFPQSSMPTEPFALLLHDETAHHSAINLPEKPALVIGAARPDARSSRQVGHAAKDFAIQSVANGVAQAADEAGCPSAIWPENSALADILDEAGINHVVMPYLPNGWTRDALADHLSVLERSGCLHMIVAELDRATWPLAKAGFFGVKKKIESTLGELGIAG